MRSETLWLILAIVAAALIATTPLFANTIGFTYGEALDDSNWGVNADYEGQLADNVKFGAEGLLQTGDVYAGNLNLSVTLWDKLRLESNNIFTGYEIATLGRDNDLGASYVFSLGGLEISAGLFGKNGNPFQPVFELADPTDPTSAALKDSGILVKDGSTLNLGVRTELEFSILGRDVEVGLRSLFEVAGEEGTEKAHQLRADIQTGGQLRDGINWVVQAQVIAQAWAGEITYQRTTNIGLNYQF